MALSFFRASPLEMINEKQKINKFDFSIFIFYIFFKRVLNKIKYHFTIFLTEILFLLIL